jgi:hypothetical protein
MPTDQVKGNVAVLERSTNQAPVHLYPAEATSQATCKPNQARAHSVARGKNRKDGAAKLQCLDGTLIYKFSKSKLQLLAKYRGATTEVTIISQIPSKNLGLKVVVEWVKQSLHESLAPSA